VHSLGLAGIVNCEWIVATKKERKTRGIGQAGMLNAQWLFCFSIAQITGLFMADECSKIKIGFK